MFPHNSSSHEISTETNAFVQNSKGDVVVLEGSSLSGAREGERPEHARYCDIEFINSSMMAAPISHPKATAANDFLTVLPRQSGELSFAGVGEACQSVAKETTKNPTNHLLTYDNNNKVNNHNNAEHNHQKYRKQKTPGSPFGQQLGSSAVTSKSTCKPLSDNKDSFSDVSVRVLKVSVRLVLKGDDERRGGDARSPAGVPSLVRIPKSERPQRQSRLANIVDNYSLLGSRLDHGENNKFKANLSLVSNNNYCNNNSKSVILLSSTSHGDNYLLAEFGLAGVDAKNPVNLVVDHCDENDRDERDVDDDDHRHYHHHHHHHHHHRDNRTSATNSNGNGNNNDNGTSSTVHPLATDRAIGETILSNKSTSSPSSSSSFSSTSPKSANREGRMYKSYVETTMKEEASTPPPPSLSSSSSREINRARLNRDTRNIVGVRNFVGPRRKRRSHTRYNSKAHHAGSSITLIVYKNEITDHTLQSFLDNLTKKRAASRITTTNNYLIIDRVTVIGLKQRICVPLLLMIEGYNDNCAINDDYDYYYYCKIDNSAFGVVVARACVNDDYHATRNYERRSGHDEGENRRRDHEERRGRDGNEKIRIVNDNHDRDVIGDIVNVAACYETSCNATTNISVLGSQNDGIRRTEATMFTVGALSFQDNDKSNDKPLNDSFKDKKCQASNEVDLESNSAYAKSVSKSTPGVKFSDKSEASRARIYGTMMKGYCDYHGDDESDAYDGDCDDDEDNDDDEREDNDDYRAEARIRPIDEIVTYEDAASVEKIVNIPKQTTCEPTMTLKCQSATVTSQTNDVPVTRDAASNNSNDTRCRCCCCCCCCCRHDIDATSDVRPNGDNAAIIVIIENDGDNCCALVRLLLLLLILLRRCCCRRRRRRRRRASISRPRNYDENKTTITGCIVERIACHVDHRTIIDKAYIDRTRFNDSVVQPYDRRECSERAERERRESTGIERDAARSSAIGRDPTTTVVLTVPQIRARLRAYLAARGNVEDAPNDPRSLDELKRALLDIAYRTNRNVQQQRDDDDDDDEQRDDDSVDPATEYKQRWGIPSMLRLRGGGESSLNSGGGANWGSAPATAPNNNNNNANQSGWGGTPGNPTGSAVPPNNWGGNNVNRAVTGNPNANQNQGPPGTQNNPGNVNKANNPNQSGNPQSGQPTSQSTNPTPGNQNSAGQWSQQGKSNNPGGPGVPNPTTQNNNGSNGPQQPSGSNANNNQVANPAQGTVATTGTAVATNPSTKAQLEQLNTMREALFSQDGWGCQHVNQDTNWDVPASPEPAMTKDGVPMWKPPVNNGTDLWEANLRNGGQPPPPQQAKTPWGHTPSTNIGGTWGEDDDATDSSNMWTGAPAPSQPNTAQWPGAAGNQTGPSWGDPRLDPRDPRDLRSVDPREMRDPRDHRMTLDPRDHMRVMDPMAARDPRMADMRGDPRGISGRLNGANADAMWGQPPGPSHHQLGHQHPSGGGPPAKMISQSSMNQWAAPPPKEVLQSKPTGWEEPSPPTQRRNVPNYDDGTSLWGNPAANQRAMPGGKASHWKDLPTANLARGGMQCPPGMPQNRMPGQPGMKPDVGVGAGGGGGGGGGGPMWGHPGGGPGGRNGSWTDGPHETTTWDEPKTPAAWNEPQLNQATWGGPGGGHKSKLGGPGTGGWADTDMDPTPSWSHPAKPALTKDVIWNSREFRHLCDLGYKKEDVEVALRNREMNRDEALELLNQVRTLEHWRRHDAQSVYDPSSQPTTAAAYPRFNHVAQQMSFPPGAGVPSGAATGNVSGSVASASLLKLQQQQQQQAAVQLQQQQPSANPPQPPFNQTSRTLQNPPSTQQLRMLVQQIQLAVQEGYLNQQILNQPLAPPTLLLLNQLLQQIKVLQQLHQQHSMQNSLKGNGQTMLQISVQITKTKQQITNLQNQIAVQQATYMKQQQQQQQQQQQHQAGPSQTSDYYKTSSVHDPMSALQNSFSDLAMNKEPPVSQQQSRLNQWKLPSLDKDGDLTANEFSRAPGTTSKPPQTPVGLSHTHSSPNMNPLLGQGDGTWSSRLGDSGWPDAGNNDATDGKDWQPGGTAFTDLVPEFEPGKPWKMKNIEDDPSITPGSVVRSLSLAAIKDPDAIFSSSSKTSPPPQSVNADTSIPSLSNSTWSFHPPATTQSAFASSKNTWTDPAPSTYSELWGVPMRVRGPPPGLGSKSAGWTTGTWLLLKNLTPQIDGSTLKTLCMQHGPVLDFRLFLNHGIALTKYSTRDEATKAQGALNNCVLGNTTIFAESPIDNEAHTLLHTLSHGGGGQQQTGGSGNTGWGMRPTKKAGPPPDTWSGSSSQLWGAPPTSNSLWSNSGIDASDTQRTTPSSLNLYLPGDLLGGESM